jgi:hypothetical protein
MKERVSLHRHPTERTGWGSEAGINEVLMIMDEAMMESSLMPVPQ